MNSLRTFFISVLLAACASTKPVHQTQNKFEFADQIPENTRQSLVDYHSNKKLSNGTIYGDSVKSLNLSGQSSESLDQALAKLQCDKTVDVIREPKHNKPVKDAKGKTTPIWIWLCKDGGVIRAKPNGDPNNKFMPQPHASKSLRYPADGEYKNFQSETIKIDNAGNALPKWPADLKSKDPAIISEWSKAAHTDLVQLHH